MTEVKLYRELREQYGREMSAAQIEKEFHMRKDSFRAMAESLPIARTVSGKRTHYHTDDVAKWRAKSFIPAYVNGKPYE